MEEGDVGFVEPLPALDVAHCEFSESSRLIWLTVVLPFAPFAPPLGILSAQTTRGAGGLGIAGAGGLYVCREGERTVVAKDTSAKLVRVCVSIAYILILVHE